MTQEDKLNQLPGIRERSNEVYDYPARNNYIRKLMRQTLETSKDIWISSLDDRQGNIVSIEILDSAVEMRDCPRQNVSAPTVLHESAKTYCKVEELAVTANDFQKLFSKQTISTKQSYVTFNTRAFVQYEMVNRSQDAETVLEAMIGQYQISPSFYKLEMSTDFEPLSLAIANNLRFPDSAREIIIFFMIE